jgi:hypothetical protein
MSAQHDLDRQLNAFLVDGPTTLPDASFDAVRDRTEQTRQRVVLGPWRVPDMNKLVPLGVGIAGVAVAVFVGGQLLASPAPGGVGAVPSVQPSAMPSPSPTPSRSPSASPATSPPPLIQSFTSPLHGISLSYPEGWTARAATESWTASPGVPEFLDPGFDVLHDPVQTDHLFLYIRSQPIVRSTPQDWVAASIGCMEMEPITVDGATGMFSNDCETVAVTTAGRGYQISLARSDDDPDVVAPYDMAWFEEVLATVQLHPEDAVDVAPSATP